MQRREARDKVDISAVLQEIRKMRDEVDVSAILAELRRVRAELDLAPVIQEIRKNRVEVDTSAVLAAARKATAEIDLSPVLREIRESRPKLDLTEVRAEVRKARAEVDLAQVLGAIRESRAEVQKACLKVDISPVLQELRESSAELSAKLKADLPTVLAEVRMVRGQADRSHVGFEELREAVRGIKGHLDRTLLRGPLMSGTAESKAMGAEGDEESTTDVESTALECGTSAGGTLGDSDALFGRREVGSPCSASGVQIPKVKLTEMALSRDLTALARTLLMVSPRSTCPSEFTEVGKRSRSSELGDLSALSAAREA